MLSAMEQTIENGLGLNGVNGGETNCRIVQCSSDWPVILFLPHAVLYLARWMRTADGTAAVAFQLLVFLAHGNHLRTVTLFGPPERQKILGDNLLHFVFFYPSTDPSVSFPFLFRPCSTVTELFALFLPLLLLSLSVLPLVSSSCSSLSRL